MFSFKDSEKLRSELLAISDIFNVIIDHAWLERLKAAAIGYKIILLITISLGLASVFVISNMVRMAIESRREEIVVIKLVGGAMHSFADHFFVRALVWFWGRYFGFNSVSFGRILFKFSNPCSSLSYKIDFVFVSLGVIEAVNIAILGGLLGIMGRGEQLLGMFL